MPNSHSCSRGKVWRRAHRQSGKRIPGACVKKSKSIKSRKMNKSRSVRKMKKSKSLKMRKSKSRSVRKMKKSKSRSKKSKSRSVRKMKKSKSRSKKSKSRSKSRKYHGLLDDLTKAAKGAVNKLTGAATKAAGALVPSGVPYLSSAAKKAIKGAGDAARFEGVTGYHRMFKGLPQKPYWM
jgi:hypothetical protein